MKAADLSDDLEHTFRPLLMIPACSCFYQAVRLVICIRHIAMSLNRLCPQVQQNNAPVQPSLCVVRDTSRSADPCLTLANNHRHTFTNSDFGLEARQSPRQSPWRVGSQDGVDLQRVGKSDMQCHLRESHLTCVFY